MIDWWTDKSLRTIKYGFNSPNKLRKIFALHGICKELVSDNGSQFVSEEFKSYLEELGIKHTRGSPYWARANGLVENFNKSLKEAIRAARDNMSVIWP
jgi:transposase InsO family protein